MACAPDGSTHLAWQEHVGSKADIRYVSGQQNRGPRRWRSATWPSIRVSLRWWSRKAVVVSARPGARQTPSPTAGGS